MHYYKAFGLNILSAIPLPELTDGDPALPVDLHIQKERIQLPKLAKTQIYRRNVRASFAQDQENSLFLHWEGIASFRASAGTHLTIDPETNTPDILSLFTVSEALGLILFQRGLFLLHGSAVLVGDEAWCFMGAPGTGKSTTAAAFIQAGCPMLSDDLTAIKLDENGLPTIIPAYPQLKIWEEAVTGLDYNRAELQPVSEGVTKFSYQPKSAFCHNPVKLGKLIFLHKVKNKAAQKQIGPAELPGELIKHFPLPAELLTGEALKRHFIQSMQFADTVETVSKRRPEGFNNLQNWVRESISETPITQ